MVKKSFIKIQPILLIFIATANELELIIINQDGIIVDSRTKIFPREILDETKKIAAEKKIEKILRKKSCNASTHSLGKETPIYADSLAQLNASVIAVPDPTVIDVPDATVIAVPDDLRECETPLLGYYRSPITTTLSQADEKSCGHESTSFEGEWGKPTEEAINLLASSLPSGGKVIDINISHI